MAEERLDLIKGVFDKIQYLKTIDTSFNELGVTTVNVEEINQVDIGAFFQLYNRIFYDIPALGNVDSHQYLVRTSGEYINFDEVNDEIAALQAEIAQLRSDLLNAQMELVKAQTIQSDNPETKQQLDQLQQDLEIANQQLIDANTTNAESTSTSINNVLEELVVV
jgi:hypothetical protein